MLYKSNNQIQVSSTTSIGGPYAWGLGSRYHYGENLYGFDLSGIVCMQVQDSKNFCSLEEALSPYKHRKIEKGGSEEGNYVYVASTSFA